MEAIDTGYGKEAAVTHTRFVSHYRISVGEKGTSIEGFTFDGRATGTCDRCGAAITYVYVFANAAGTSSMHVGIDCATTRMGVPLAEIKRARAARKQYEYDKRAAAAKLSRAEREAQAAGEREERLAANAEVVAELNALGDNANASEWERGAIRWAIGTVAREGGEWLENPQCADHRKTLANVEAIRTRLSLCATSKHDTGKRRAFKLTAYRKALSFESTYGYRTTTVFVNFLCDDSGNAYVYKGSHCFALGTEVRGTFTPGEAETRDGLTATRIARPHGVETTAPADVE